MSTFPAILSHRPATLEQLAALSQEIAALARAGVPLDRGLRALALDMPGRLGKLADEISTGLESGRSLEQVVAELSASLPPTYRAVIAAGLRAGRLPTAMEGIAHTSRRIIQLRNSICLSLVYPLIVLTLTWSLGTFMMMRPARVVSEMLIEFDAAAPWVVDAYNWIARNADWIGPILPVLFGAWLAWAWFRSAGLAEGVELHPLFAFGAVGTLARMQRASRLSSLTELLSLLISHSVPLPEAVELATAAVGSSRLAAGGQKLAEQLRRGELIQHPPPGFPPLVAWTITSGQSADQLCRALTRSASVYRDELHRRGQWLAIYVPLMLTLAVCGGAVAIYALLLLSALGS
jgi:general secretion pathway protein F